MNADYADYMESIKTLFQDILNLYQIVDWEVTRVTHVLKKFIYLLNKTRWCGWEVSRVIPSNTFPSQ